MTILIDGVYYTAEELNEITKAGIRGSKVGPMVLENLKAEFEAIEKSHIERFESISTEDLISFVSSIQHELDRRSETVNVECGIRTGKSARKIREKLAWKDPTEEQQEENFQYNIYELMK